MSSNSGQNKRAPDLDSQTRGAGKTTPQSTIPNLSPPPATTTGSHSAPNSPTHPVSPSKSEKTSDNASKTSQLEAEVVRMKSKLDEVKRTMRDKELRDVSGRISPIDLSQSPLPNARVRRTLKQHSGKVLCVDWSSDGVHLCSSSTDGDVIIWNAFTKEIVKIIPCKIPWLITCAFSPVVTSHVICYGGLDNRCSIMRISKQPPNENKVVSKASFACHTSFVSCSSFLGEDQQLLTGSGDGTCILWDVEGQKAEQTFRSIGTQILCLDTNPINPWNVFCTGSSDNIARIFDIRSGACEMMFEGHVSDINTLKFLPSGDSFISGSDDSTCRLNDLRCDQELQVYRNDSIIFGVSSIDTTLSGRVFFAAHDDSTINAWDLLHGKRVANYLNFHDDKVTRLRLCPDGFTVATSSWDKSIKIWC